MADAPAAESLLELAAQIVSDHVAHNAVAPEALPALIQQVYRTLTDIEKGSAEPQKPKPAVPINKSIFPDYLICLEDGKHFSILKRHLLKTFQMTPDQYRQKWGLPDSYPMVAPNYTKRRSSLAKAIGLGKRPVISATPPAERRQ